MVQPAELLLDRGSPQHSVLTQRVPPRGGTQCVIATASRQRSLPPEKQLRPRWFVLGCGVAPPRHCSNERASYRAAIAPVGAQGSRPTSKSAPALCGTSMLTV